MREEEEEHGSKPLTTALVAAPQAAHGERSLCSLKIFFFFF